LKYSLSGRRDGQSVEEASDQWICPKPGRVERDTMISGFFDPRGNHAFLNVDASRAHEFFSGLQNAEARLYTQQKEDEWNARIKKADALRTQHNNTPSSEDGESLWTRFKSFFGAN